MMLKKKVVIITAVGTIYAAAIALHLLAGTKAWAYPDYAITVAETEDFARSAGRIAAIILSSVLLAAAYAVAGKKNKKSGDYRDALQAEQSMAAPVSSFRIETEPEESQGRYEPHVRGAGGWMVLSSPALPEGWEVLTSPNTETEDVREVPARGQHTTGSLSKNTVGALSKEQHPGSSSVMKPAHVSDGLKKGNGKERVLPCILALAGIAVYAVWLFMHGHVLYELQLLLIGGFAVWSWFAAAVSRKYFGMQTGSAVYAVFGFCSFLAANYSCTYRQISGGKPAALLFMTAVFMLAYVMVFLEERTLRVRRKAAYTAVGSAVLTVLFSFPRLTEIAASAGEAFPSPGRYTNWFRYRIKVLQAVFGGNFIDTELDVQTREQVQNFDILWLGQAFPKWMQAVYILLTAALFCCMIWIIRNSGSFNRFCFFLAGSIFTANIVGVIAEVNLFYGADIGVLVSQNSCQLVPVIFFLAEFWNCADIS